MIKILKTEKSIENASSQNKTSENMNNDNNSSNKDNIAAWESSIYWKSTLKYVINITEFLEKANSYEHLIK